MFFFLSFFLSFFLFSVCKRYTYIIDTIRFWMNINIITKLSTIIYFLLCIDTKSTNSTLTISFCFNSRLTISPCRRIHLLHPQYSITNLSLLLRLFSSSSLVGYRSLLVIAFIFLSLLETDWPFLIYSNLCFFLF